MYIHFVYRTYIRNYSSIKLCTCYYSVNHYLDCVCYIICYKQIYNTGYIKMNIHI